MADIVPSNEPQQNLASWKRLAIFGASCGVALAVALSAIVAALSWYSTRPVPPKPWNSKAIIATFDYPEVEGENPRTIVLNYILENTTEADYRVPRKGQLEINARLRRENSLSGAWLVSIDEDETFLPAKQRRRFAIHMGYPIAAEMGLGEANEDQNRRWQGIASYMRTEMPNLNGFVIFDTVNRYQIEFPNGWDRLDVK